MNWLTQLLGGDVPRPPTDWNEKIADARSYRCEQASADPSAAVRCVALAHRFARACGDERDRLVVFALGDASSRIRTLAAVQVRKGASAPPAEVLLGIVDRDSEALASVLRTATHLPPWSRLALLLDSCGRSPRGGPAEARVHAELDRWNRNMMQCFVFPSPQEARTAARAWALVRDGLPAHTQRGINAHLQAFGVVSGH